MLYGDWLDKVEDYLFDNHGDHVDELCEDSESEGWSFSFAARWHAGDTPEDAAEKAVSALDEARRCYETDCSGYMSYSDADSGL